MYSQVGHIAQWSKINKNQNRTEISGGCLAELRKKQQMQQMFGFMTR